MASMMGLIAWNSGALGNITAWNLITWTPLSASLTSNRGVSGPATFAGMHTPITLPGTRLQAFAGDFYDRIHITTRLLDLGNMISDQTSQITIWNAYRRAWSLTSVLSVNAEGITVGGQPAPPLQYNPLQERIYTVSISTDGPAQIDATLSWVFSNGEVVALDIVGQRIVLWNWRPDWTQGMVERLQWYTDVLQAGRGEEQRRALRLNPRQYLEFGATIDGNDRQMMESILWNWGARSWAVPLWYDGQQLAATLAIGATSIPLNPASRGYQVGELVVLTNGTPSVYEVVEVGSLSSSIGLSRPTQQTWPAGTMVYPARPAIIENVAQLGRFTAQVVSLRLQWRMLEPTTWAAAATPTYRSLPVFELKPNWVEDPLQDFERSVTVLDAGVGLTTTTDRAEMPLTTQRMRFSHTGKAAIDTWKQRLWALRGKQGAIWVPTWSDDLTVVAQIGDAALNIDVRWMGYTKYLQMDPGRRDIRIQLNNGTIYYRRITGAIEVSPTVERLSIDSALGATVNVSDIALVCFMALSRSDSDAHEIAYFQGDVADTVFSARAFRTTQ